MFEQAFKNIDDVLWKEAGCTTELDYTEQSSWLLFLKYLDSFKADKISFPRTLGEQKKIISKLDALATETQRLENLYAQKQMALAELKKSLLHQAFTGQL